MAGAGERSGQGLVCVAAPLVSADLDRSSQCRGFIEQSNSFAEYAPEPNPETKKKDLVWLR
jgi:hypothetical protein